VTTLLASHGFVLIAPSHAGAVLNDCPSPSAASNPDTSADDRYEERPDDLLHALSWTLDASTGKDQLLAGLLDGSRVGLVGHSRGANTVLWLASLDARFKAVVSMAPASTRLTQAAAATTQAATMLMGGKLDNRSPYDEQRQLFGLLQSSGSEHWLVSLPRAGHDAFIDFCPSPPAGCGPEALPHERAHSLVKRWTTVFLRNYVAGDIRYGALLDPLQVADDPEIELEQGYSSGPP
jgi:predicted dienelactone hydrolase